MAVGWLSPPHTRSGAQFNYLEIYHIEDYQFPHLHTVRSFRGLKVVGGQTQVSQKFKGHSTLIKALGGDIARYVVYTEAEF